MAFVSLFGNVKSLKRTKLLLSYFPRHKFNWKYNLFISLCNFIRKSHDNLNVVIYLLGWFCFLLHFYKCSILSIKSHIDFFIRQASDLTWKEDTLLNEVPEFYWNEVEVRSDFRQLVKSLFSWGSKQLGK
jgi:hypothetical protein